MIRGTAWDTPKAPEPEPESKPGLPPCSECGDPAAWRDPDRGGHFCTFCLDPRFFDLAKRHSEQVARERA